MWALLSSRVRRWALLAVGLPVAAWALDRLGDTVERRWGPSRGASALRGASGLLRRPRRRHPLGRRW